MRKYRGPNVAGKDAVHFHKADHTGMRYPVAAAASLAQDWLVCPVAQRFWGGRGIPDKGMWVYGLPINLRVYGYLSIAHVAREEWLQLPKAEVPVFH